MFAEDLSVYLDSAAGFATDVLIDAVVAQAILDDPGIEILGGEVVTTEPSAMVAATVTVAEGSALVVDAGDLPAQLAHLAGTYTVRQVMPDSPDGALVRLILARVS